MPLPDRVSPRAGPPPRLSIPQKARTHKVAEVKLELEADDVPDLVPAVYGFPGAADPFEASAPPTQISRTAIRWKKTTGNGANSARKALGLISELD